jgi:Asp-tRNA(Asn)/Glu-tRNA(Gln) amidotransferase A subunit family amidase
MTILGAHDDELDLLDAEESQLVAASESMAFANDLDRRHFVFASLAAAAATTFGFGARVLAQPPAGGAGAPQPAVPPVALDNGEAVSWTFQPYPGGTGALLEKAYREKGPAAFARQRFAWRGGAATPGAFLLEPWGAAPFPTNEEEIAFLPVHRLAAAIRAKKITSVRLTTLYLDRLERYNPTLLCAVTILRERALKEAAAMDAELAAGKYRGPLHGIPWGVKDLFAVKGTPTTWGAADFENRVIDEDSEVVVRLRDAGAVLMAKLSTGQFAQGGNWFRGGTKNPWNLSQSSSGSSAGPGSATAAGCVAFGIGTETSGSIVSPATACGLSALRPTFGRVSRSGGMVLAWSMDRVGPMTRHVEDSAIIFNIIHGADEKDPGSITMPFRFQRDIDFKAVRFGVRKQTNADPVFAAFLDHLKALGANPVEMVEPPTVAGSQGGINVESAAAFDAYVQWKAKQMGIDMAAVMERYGRQGGGGGRGGAPAGGAPGAAPGAAPAAPAANPLTPASTGTDGQLNRWVPGRTPTAFEFINTQRRRQMLIAAWQKYLTNIDVYVGAADTGVHAQTGHPVAVVQMGYGVRQQGRGGGGGGGGAAAGGRGGAGADSARPAPPPLNPQPICTQVAGNLYLDDIVLSVAAKYQRAHDWVKERPTLG